MCGLAAYIGNEADQAMLVSAVAGAANRGDDMYGIATRTVRVVGLGRLPYVTSASEPTLFHARLATGGGYALDDAQPLQRDGWTLAHNGTVPQPVQDLTQWQRETGNDSEALLILGRREGLSYALGRLRRYAVIALTPTRVYAARSGLPLYHHTDPSGTYLSSGPIGSPLDEHLVYRVTSDGATPWARIEPFAQPSPWKRAGERA